MYIPVKNPKWSSGLFALGPMLPLFERVRPPPTPPRKATPAEKWIAFHRGREAYFISSTIRLFDLTIPPLDSGKALCRLFVLFLSTSRRERSESGGCAASRSLRQSYRRFETVEVCYHPRIHKYSGTKYSKYQEKKVSDLNVLLSVSAM